MQTWIRHLGLATALTATALAAQAVTLASASDALGADRVESLSLQGAGRWFQFGQAPAPGLPWPQFDVSNYSADIHFAAPSARVQISRLQTIEEGRWRPASVLQKVDQYVNGDKAWNVGVAPAASTATWQPAAVEERAAEVWSTPQGFLKAAKANQAVSRPIPGGIELSFTLAGKYRYVGEVNEANEVVRVRTWIDNPVTGDTEVETAFAAYRDQGGLRFPSHIVRSQGGFRVLDITISSVKANATAPLTVPDGLAATPAPQVAVSSSKLAEGVYYLTGGTHHSVAIDQRDHVVLVEAPLNEARSNAVIAKVKELIPGKPIRFLVNTHVHFDHSGGLRTLVDEGATIVTHKDNVAYYQHAWQAPRKINPDRLATSGKAARFATFTQKHVLSDGQRRIEVHNIAGSGHNDAFALVYLPAEKILIEADAYTPLAPNAAPPASVNPYALNLLENVEELKLDVDQIAALHGPGVVKLADLKTFVGRKVAAQ
ncbi:MBL fold metallo-hydrolase [Aquabacterium sp.]|uniref:MBL fold metallo-hydrolase n=1 Tax=Aquabacterium sp. TaxID=1872578 RepID=UPI0025BF88FF|nr:MBL fold metallo-hydrolase [Aquabacterium sp.]